MIRTTMNDSLAFALKMLWQTRNLTLMKLAVSIHRTGVTDSSGDWDELHEDIAIGMGGLGGHGQSTIDSP